MEKEMITPEYEQDASKDPQDVSKDPQDSSQERMLKALKFLLLNDLVDCPVCKGKGEHLTGLSCSACAGDGSVWVREKPYAGI